MNSNDIFAQPVEFYPNGKKVNEITGKYMKEGIGSKILDILISDSLKQDAKVMFVFTDKVSMKSFLRKKTLLHMIYKHHIGGKC